MAQVIANFAAVDRTRDVPVYSHAGVKTAELATSGTAANTSVFADAGDYARVFNAGTGVVWVAAGVGVTAAIATAGSYALGGGQVIDLGPLPAGARVSAVDDS